MCKIRVHIHTGLYSNSEPPLGLEESQYVKPLYSSMLIFVQYKTYCRYEN